MSKKILFSSLVLAFVFSGCLKNNDKDSVYGSLPSIISTYSSSKESALGKAATQDVIKSCKKLQEFYTSQGTPDELGETCKVYLGMNSE